MLTRGMVGRMMASGGAILYHGMPRRAMRRPGRTALAEGTAIL